LKKKREKNQESLPGFLWKEESKIVRKYKCKISKTVELTIERENHIVEYHPDVKDYLPKIQEVLKNPDQIRKSKHDPKVLLFYRYFSNIRGGKYLVVVAKINERNFVLTAYLTDRILTGKKIYEKKKKSN